MCDMLDQMDLMDIWRDGREWLARHFAEVQGDGDGSGGDDDDSVGDELPEPAAMSDPDELAKWRSRVRALARVMARKWGQAQWREEVASHGTLQLYAKLHPNLEFARYLDACVYDKEATKLRTRLRANTYPLGWVVARWFPWVDADSCPLCGHRTQLGDAAEDVEHFVLKCPALATPRGNLDADVMAACRSKGLSESI